MKVLDRYILRQFLINFVILSAVMMLLFVLVDLIVDLDEFLKAGATHAERWGNRHIATIATVLGYYGPLLPLLYTYFCGLIVVAAMGFTLNAMQRSKELVAIVASGVSLFRVAAPLLIAGIVLNALALPIQEFLVPPLAAQLSRSKGTLSNDHAEANPVYFAVDEKGDLLSAGDFDGRRELTNITILERDNRSITTRRISATKAIWNDEYQRWRLVMATPDTPQLESELGIERHEQQDVMHFSTELSPTVLRARQQATTLRLLSLSSLQALQHNNAIVGQRAQITQVIWSRFSMLVVNVLVLVMALPMFLVKQPVHFVGQAAQAAVIAIGSWGGALMTMQVSTAALNPVASAWLPVVIYLPLSVYLLQRVES